MNSQSDSREHWSDDELLAYVYGVGPENAHIETCSFCSSRLNAMRSVREERELEDSSVSVEMLAKQRREIYAKLSKSTGFWHSFRPKHWATAGVLALVLGGSALTYHEYAQQREANDRISDADLAQDVSMLASNIEARPAAPLEALFEE